VSNQHQAIRNKKLNFHLGGPTVQPTYEYQRPTFSCGKKRLSRGDYNSIHAMLTLIRYNVT